MFFLQTHVPGQDFFTISTFGTLAGATFIVFIVCSSIQSAFNYNPKWLALLVSIIVSLIGAYLTKDPYPTSTSPEGARYIIALLNGFLIYATASGINQVLGHDLHQVTAPPSSDARTNDQELKTIHKKKRTFFTRWK